MRNNLLTALALGAVAAPAIAVAQVPTVQMQVPVLTGTRLDVSATGEVTRVPDLAIISAGVQTLRPTATAAIEENAARMERVRAALKRAGIEDFRWHDLRHCWASWHVQNGTPLFALQELGGWESPEMVRRYAHLSACHLAPYA